MNTQILDRKEHYGIRKLTTGAASVLLATSVLLAGQGHQVQADTVDSDANHENTDNHANLPENDVKDFQTEDTVKASANKADKQTQTKTTPKVKATLRVKVHYTDETGKEVGNEIIIGAQGSKMHFTLPSNYKAVNQDTLKQTFDDQIELTIPVTKIDQKLATVKETTDTEQSSNKNDQIGQNDHDVNNIDSSSITPKQDSVSNKLTDKLADVDQEQKQAVINTDKTVLADANKTQKIASNNNSDDKLVNNSDKHIAKKAINQVENNNSKHVIEHNDLDDQNNIQRIAKPVGELNTNLVQKTKQPKQATADNSPLVQSIVNKTVDANANVGSLNTKPVDDNMFNVVNALANYQQIATVDSRANSSNPKIQAALNMLYNTSFVSLGAGNNGRIDFGNNMYIDNLAYDIKGKTVSFDWHVTDTHHYKLDQTNPGIRITGQYQNDALSDNTLYFDAHTRDIVDKQNRVIGKAQRNVSQSDDGIGAYTLELDWQKLNNYGSVETHITIPTVLARVYANAKTDAVDNSVVGNSPVQLTLKGEAIIPDGSGYYYPEGTPQQATVHQGFKVDKRSVFTDSTLVKSDWLPITNTAQKGYLVKNQRYWDVTHTVPDDKNSNFWNNGSESKAYYVYQISPAQLANKTHFEITVNKNANINDLTNSIKSQLSNLIFNSKPARSGQDLKDEAFKENNIQYYWNYGMQDQLIKPDDVKVTNQSLTDNGSQDSKTFSFDLQIPGINNYSISTVVREDDDYINDSVRNDTQSFFSPDSYSLTLTFDGPTSNRDNKINGSDLNKEQAAMQDILGANRPNTPMMNNYKQFVPYSVYGQKATGPNIFKVNGQNINVTPVFLDIVAPDPFDASIKGVQGSGRVVLVDNNSGKELYAMPYTGILGEKDGVVDANSGNNWLKTNKYHIVKDQKYTSIPTSVHLIKPNMDDIIIKVTRDVHVSEQKPVYRLVEKLPDGTEKELVNWQPILKTDDDETLMNHHYLMTDVYESDEQGTARRHQFVPKTVNGETLSNVYIDPSGAYIADDSDNSAAYMITSNYGKQIDDLSSQGYIPILPKAFNGSLEVDQTTSDHRPYILINDSGFANGSLPESHTFYITYAKIPEKTVTFCYWDDDEQNKLLFESAPFSWKPKFNEPLANGVMATYNIDELSYLANNMPILSNSNYIIDYANYAKNLFNTDENDAIVHDGLTISEPSSEYPHGSINFDNNKLKHQFTLDTSKENMGLLNGKSIIGIFVHHKHKQDSQDGVKSINVDTTAPEAAYWPNKYMFGSRLINNHYTINTDTDLQTNTTKKTIDLLNYYVLTNDEKDVVDLGPATFSQNKDGQWGFWDVYNAVHNQYKNLDPHSMYIQPINEYNLPDYDTHISQVDNVEDVIIKGKNRQHDKLALKLNNLNDPDTLLKMLEFNVHVTLTPQSERNPVDYTYIDSQNNSHSSTDANYKASPIVVDSAGKNISLTDMLSAETNNGKLTQGQQDRLTSNTYIASVQIGDQTYSFTRQGDEWLINVPGHNAMTLQQFENYSEQLHLPIHDFTIADITAPDGSVLPSVKSSFKVLNYNRKNTDGDWYTDVPKVHFNIKDLPEPTAQGFEHDYRIHYNIPKGIDDDFPVKSGELDIYQVHIHPEYHWQWHPYLVPIYRTEYEYDDDGNIIGSYEVFDHDEDQGWEERVFDGWVDDDPTSDEYSTIGIDDVQENATSTMPLVYDSHDMPETYQGYKLKIYGYDKNGNEVDLTNGSHMINVGTKHWFAPYAYQGISSMDENLTDVPFRDNEIGDDVYVTYVPQPAQRQIIYRDIKDYPDIENGHDIDSYQIHGLEGSQTTLGYQNHIPKGYILDDDQVLPDNDYTFNWDEDHEPVIVYVHVLPDVKKSQDKVDWIARVQVDPSIKNLDPSFYNDLTSNPNNALILTANNGQQTWVYIGQDSDNSLATVERTITTNPITQDFASDDDVKLTSPDMSTIQLANIQTLHGRSPVMVIKHPIHNLQNRGYQFRIIRTEIVNGQETDEQDLGLVDQFTLPTKDEIQWGHDYRYTIIITTADINNKIHYIDELTGHEVGEQDTIIGKLNDKVQYNLNIPNNYELSDNQKDTNVQITSSSSDNPQAIVTINKSGMLTVYVHGKYVYVDHHDPKTPEQEIPGRDPNYPDTSHYPHGVENDYLNHPITETIYDNRPDGSTTTVHSVNFFRNALIDPLNNITYVDDSKKPLPDNDWTVEPGKNVLAGYDINPINGYHAVVKVLTGKTNGYTASHINSITPKQDDGNIVIQINYVKDAGNKVVALVDDDATMREVARYRYESKATNNQLDIPAGYHLVNDGFSSGALNDVRSGSWDNIPIKNGNPDLIVIHLAENVKNVTKDDSEAHINIKRQVVIVNPDNTRDSMTMTIELERQAIYNEVTKKTSYGNWYVKSIPTEIYDHNNDDGESEDSGIIKLNLYKYKPLTLNPGSSASGVTTYSAEVNDQLLKYFGGQANFDNFINTLNGHAEVIIPEIYIPDKTGYAKEIDNANTDGINISNDSIPEETLLLVNNQGEADQLGTETAGLQIINVDNHNFDDDLDKTIVVHYIKGQKEMTYRYIDQTTGRIVGGDSVIGEEGSTVDLNASVPNGYQLAKGQTDFQPTYTFTAEDNTTLTVYVTPVHEHHDLKALTPADNSQLYSKLKTGDARWSDLIDGLDSDDQVQLIPNVYATAYGKPSMHTEVHDGKTVTVGVSLASQWAGYYDYQTNHVRNEIIAGPIRPHIEHVSELYTETSPNGDKTRFRKFHEYDLGYNEQSKLNRIDHYLQSSDPFDRMQAKKWLDAYIDSHAWTNADSLIPDQQKVAQAMGTLNDNLVNSGAWNSPDDRGYGLMAIVKRPDGTYRIINSTHIKRT